LPLEQRQRQVSEAIRRACRFDVLACKPGNVSIRSPGHGMTAADFLASAAAVAPVLARSHGSVGEAILDAVIASFAVAHCNTNLGIILLVAPLARAAVLRRRDEDLRERLRAVLDGLSRYDASRVFAAIRYASPGGLGGAERQDVAAEPSLPLREVMGLAAVRDRIAYQYANQFEDIFDLGVPLLRVYRERWGSVAWAAVGLYLALLSRYPDTHVVRKYGANEGEELRLAARTLESDFKACENPVQLGAKLGEFDRELKRKGVNPGTSADLTTASVLALLLSHA
jgi:triphosphoribosyl-dephospho-CoA synthase